jgi:hypothetical protein
MIWEVPRPRLTKLGPTLALLVAIATAWPGAPPGYVKASGSRQLVMSDAALCHAASSMRSVERLLGINLAPITIPALAAARVPHREAPLRFGPVHEPGARGARAPPAC